jgi:nucleotide-binding universal stress UspA family protein
MSMFKTILHANDGSEPAFKALTLAIRMAKQDGAALHLICVEEIPPMPEFIEEVREARGIAARRFHTVMERARRLAAMEGVQLQTHTRSGHPVRVIVEFVGEIGADLLVIGATGHSALYERMVGSRADRIVQLAECPVLVVK